MFDVRAVNLDSFDFPRLDLVKIDVEGMELDVLAGGAKCIGDNHPILLVEALKIDANALHTQLQNLGYVVIPSGMNFVAVHNTDHCLESIKIEAPATP